MFKYHRNTIFTNGVDFYCLCCDCHIKKEEDVTTHIEMTVHKENLHSTPYVDKYKEDYMRKVSKGYYCEVCNILLSTLATIGLHCNAINHKNNKCKAPMMLKRLQNNVLVFDKIVIGEKSWNGFIDDTCVICNTEFNDENIHKEEVGHILKLIQSEVKCYQDILIFRKVDDSTSQCLTCNALFASTEFLIHIETDSHKPLYTMCPAVDQDINIESRFMEVDKKLKIITNNKVDSSETAKVNDANQKESIYTVAEEDIELCKHLNAPNYISDHNWCILCDCFLERNLVSEHLKSVHHLRLLKIHKEQLQKKKVQKSIDQERKPDHIDDEQQILLKKNSTPKIKQETSVTMNKEKNEYEKISNCLVNFQNNHIDINVESSKAYCKKCSKDLEFKVDFINLHIKEHFNNNHKKDNTKESCITTSVIESNHNDRSIKTDEGKKYVFKENNTKVEDTNEKVVSCEDNEIAKYALNSKLTYLDDSKEVFCKICNSSVPSAVKSITEHVSGKAHKSKELLKPKPQIIYTNEIVKRSARAFIQTFTLVDNMSKMDVVINNTICVNIKSFHMLTNHGSRKKCLLCCETINSYHLETDSHKKALEQSPVIMSFQGEFIREVKVDSFHCGYCNDVSNGLTELENHLKSILHSEAKIFSAWRLHQCLPEIMNTKRLHSENPLELVISMGDVI